MPGFGRELREPSTKGWSGFWSTNGQWLRSEVELFQLRNKSKAQERLMHAIYCPKIHERHMHTHTDAHHKYWSLIPPQNLLHSYSVFLHKQDLFIFASGLIRIHSHPGIIVSCDASLWINLLPVNLLLKLAGGAPRHSLAADGRDSSVHIPPKKRNVKGIRAK